MPVPEIFNDFKQIIVFLWRCPHPPTGWAGHSAMQLSRDPGHCPLEALLPLAYIEESLHESTKLLHLNLGQLQQSTNEELQHMIFFFDVYKNHS